MSNQDENTVKAFVELPGLQEIFEALRQGRHICQTDGAIYYNLKENHKAFTALFAQLGFELKKHRRDFYYFHSSNSMSGQSEKMAVFMFILIEHIADKGYNIESTLMNQQFAYNQLPHLKNARYKSIMSQLDVLDEDGLISIVTSMDRTGFAERINDSSFAFKSPIYRFLDICQDISVKQKTNTSLEE
jgi:hypothetical protein